MSYLQTNRQRGTDTQGSGFSQNTVILVWQKGQSIDGHDPGTWRRDMCGYAIRLSDYGNTNSQYGWEVDHIMPLAKGGTDELSNLQPLQWDHNRRKGDTYPWHC